MKKHYSFPKIGQYHQTIRHLKLQHSYQGKDENGDPIYKEPDVWPVVKFKGTVKLHGSNGAVVFSPHGSFYCQSRENVIDEIKDNAGFAHWVNKEGHKIWEDVWHKVDLNIDKHDSLIKLIVVFGEWCCGSIQKGVALNELSKRFVIFGLKIIFEDETTRWMDSSGIINSEISVYNIEDAPTYEIEVDLNRPDKAIEQMNTWVDEIDAECPFAKMFNVSGHGEGIVWREAGKFGYDTSFKTKGESHSKSKIKKLPTVDVQKMDNIQQAIDTHCHEDRMLQIYDKVVVTEADKTPKNIGLYLQKLIEDCWTEEGDSMRASDISRKDFGAAVSKKAAKWFQNKLQEF
jgi:hypothetical protein